MVEKSVQEINERIKDGSVKVVTAEEMVDIVEEHGPEDAAREVDVVTTGTFGAMCSSGAFLNFGHADPPIKMQRVWLNDVEAYTGLAAVDAYLGATQLSEERGMDYGGGHVLEDLVAGKQIDVRATAYGTDCYPRREVETTLSIEDLNQAVMLNPRNAYQRYNVATNSTDRTLYTYMGTLLPDHGNATYSASGVLSPIYNDPDFETIGLGTRIFLCGAPGHVIGEGTQHDPTNDFSTLMVKGDMKQMDPEYIRGASFHEYGTTLYVGLGVPIPILNERIAEKTAISDADIKTSIIDYGVPRRDKPSLGEVTYEDLKTGAVEIDGREVETSSLSSFHKAREIAEELKQWIQKEEFTLSQSVDQVSTTRVFRPMKQIEDQPLVKDVMATRVTTIDHTATVEEAARLMTRAGFNHLPVLKDGRLAGIITAWDVSRAVATGNRENLEDTMTRRVITADPDEPIDVIARRLEQNNISAMPVTDNKKHVVGMIGSDDISKLVVRRR